MGNDYDSDYIEQQLNRLPEKIDLFGRRFFRFEDNLQIQYTMRGVEFNIHSPAQGNDILFVEAGQELERLIEQTLVTIETYNTLNNAKGKFEPGVFIDPNLIDQGVTNVALIRPTGAATMMAPCVHLPASFFHAFFLVRASEYLLAFGRKGNRYFFQRNDTSVYLNLPPRHMMAQNMAVAITWSLEDISISGYIGSSDRQDGRPKWEARSTDRRTDATVPPNTLYRWARQQLLLPTVNYKRPEQLCNVILEALRTLNEEITITSDIAGFWDEQRGRNRTHVPKREPVITRHIESRLRDITLQRNIDILREVQFGNSQLDLLFSAPLENGPTAKVCVEVKKAHADDLVHGLSVQLPEYMKRVGTDYGIYCVLDYGIDYPHKLSQFETHISDPNFLSSIGDNLEVLLNSVIRKMPYRHIHVVYS